MKKNTQYNVVSLLVHNGLQIGGRFNAANVLLAAVFFSLIISTLENILKISLKKFANSNKGCIFV